MRQELRVINKKELDSKIKNLIIHSQDLIGVKEIVWKE